MNIIFIYKTTYTNESLNFFIDALDLFVRTIVEKPKIAVSADQRRIFANARTVSVVSTAQGREIVVEVRPNSETLIGWNRQIRHCQDSGRA